MRKCTCNEIDEVKSMKSVERPNLNNYYIVQFFIIQFNFLKIVHCNSILLLFYISFLHVSGHEKNFLAKNF